jgi:heptosyltransferase-1
VVHALPAVSDLLAHCPGAEIDWLVESPFAAIPRMHHGVREVLPMAWRKWRRALLDRATWAAMGRLRGVLRERPYDLVLDLQGLLKSALWGLQARGPLVGYDRRRARCTPCSAVASWRRCSSAIRCRRHRRTSASKCPTASGRRRPPMPR